MLDLLHIFHDDDLRLDTLRVHMNGPRQNTQAAVAGLPTLCLGVAGAVRGGPHQGHLAPGHIFLEVNGKDVLRQMQSVRVVGLVDADGLRVMVYRNINGTVEGHFNALAGTTAASKAINN